MHTILKFVLSRDLTSCPKDLLIYVDFIIRFRCVGNGEFVIPGYLPSPPLNPVSLWSTLVQALAQDLSTYADAAGFISEVGKGGIVYNAVLTIVRLLRYRVRRQTSFDAQSNYDSHPQLIVMCNDTPISSLTYFEPIHTFSVHSVARSVLWFQIIKPIRKIFCCPFAVSQHRWVLYDTNLICM